MSDPGEKISGIAGMKHGYLGQSGAALQCAAENAKNYIEQCQKEGIEPTVLDSAARVCIATRIAIIGGAPIDVSSFITSAFLAGWGLAMADPDMKFGKLEGEENETKVSEGG